MTADYSHTAAWMGVTSVTYLDGTPIVGYTLTDDNGLDWTTPAPEPTGFGVALTALALLVTRRRRG